MPRAAIEDPLRNFKFVVRFADPPGRLQNALNAEDGTSGDEIGFAVVSGISVNNEMVGYREGGMNTHPWKFVGQSDFAPVTFSRGVFKNQSSLYNWQSFLHAYNENYVGGPWKGGSIRSTNASTKSREFNAYRTDIIISVLDHPMSQWAYATPSKPYPGNLGTKQDKIEIPRMMIRLFECWPGSFSFSDFNAGDSGIMIQQMTLHHEGFAVAWTPDQMRELDKTNPKVKDMAPDSDGPKDWPATT